VSYFVAPGGADHPRSAASEQMQSLEHGLRAVLAQHLGSELPGLRRIDYFIYLISRSCNHEASPQPELRARLRIVMQLRRRSQRGLTRQIPADILY
jgi:hypothetical protein